MIIFKTIPDGPGEAAMLSILLTPANMDHLAAGGVLMPASTEALGFKIVIATVDSDAEALAMLKDAVGFECGVDLSSIQSGQTLQGFCTAQGEPKND